MKEEKSPGGASQSLGLNQMEMLCWNFKKGAVDKQMPVNLNELKQCCEEEWAIES